MIEISGFYYDGKSSNRTQIHARFYENGLLEIQSIDFTLNSSLKTARISPRIGNTCRSIYLADGGKIESFANDELDVIANYFSQNRYQAFVHKLEKNAVYALGALAMTAFTIWASVEYGVPLLAKSAAYSVPFKVEQEMGQQGLQSLDKLLFHPSKLDHQIKQQLNQRFQQATADLPNAEHYRLEFRNSTELGANAFALPGGIIIVTDDLVKLAQNQQQIMAVLGHEMGHVVHKHGLRSIFQDSFTALLMAGLLGDVSSISSLAVTMPTLLVESRYSRQFELEADDYAIDFLQKKHLSLESLSQILALLQKTMPKDADEHSYFASHPAMAERIQRVNALKTTH